MTEVTQRVDEVKSIIGGTARSIAEGALRFVLANDAVSTAIPGARNRSAGRVERRRGRGKAAARRRREASRAPRRLQLLSAPQHQNLPPLIVKRVRKRIGLPSDVFISLMPSRTIAIRGARTHNLKNISVEIPQRQLTVLTGPSGSGKSSLAFNTLYAEGQRRFVESMSTYVRQFLERIDRPDVDEIEGILPAIAIEQKNSVKNARSTVATATELADHIRLFMTYCGETWCPDCGVARAQGLARGDHARRSPARWRETRRRARADFLRRHESRRSAEAADEGRLLSRLDRRRGRRPQSRRHDRLHVARARDQPHARRERQSRRR